MEHIPAPSVEHDEIYELDSLTVLQAARRAGVTQSAIVRWIRNGYLPATPSSNGWQIPANKLEEARFAADESRGTGPVTRQTGPRLVPAPEDLRRSLAVQAQEQPARLDVVGEALLSPLVELIRDQGDIVHDQAEVIGWLQAERTRLTADLAELMNQEKLAKREPAPATAEESTISDDNRVDEVVSWLWNDTARPFEAQTRVVQPNAETASPKFTENEPVAGRVVFRTRAVDHEPVKPDPEASAEDIVPSASENHAGASWHDSWFVISDEIDARANQTGHTRQIPTLQPIVASACDTTAFNDAGDLSQMIDEAERKIAQMWRDEADLRSGRSGARGEFWNSEGFEEDSESFWQRIWPLKRRWS